MGRNGYSFNDVLSNFMQDSDINRNVGVNQGLILC
jgi:hypothetical protein